MRRALALACLAAALLGCAAEEFKIQVLEVRRGLLQRCGQPLPVTRSGQAPLTATLPCGADWHHVTVQFGNGGGSRAVWAVEGVTAGGASHYPSANAHRPRPAQPT